MAKAKKRSTWKQFLPLGIASAIALLVLTSALLPKIQQSSTSTSDETTNWKTYTNTEYGYEIKYPNGLQALDITNEETWYPEKIGKPYPYGDGSYIPLKDFYKYRFKDEVLSIVTFVSSEYINNVVPKKGPTEFGIMGVRLEIKTNTIQDELKKYNEDSGSKSETIYVNNFKGTKLSRRNPRYDTEVYTILIEKGGLLYKLTNGAPGGTGDSGDIFAQILSTLKLTQ